MPESFSEQDNGEREMYEPSELERATWAMYGTDARRDAASHVPEPVDPSLYYWRNTISAEDPLVLDVGCGFGQTLDPLRELGIRRYIGVDPCLELLEVGREKYPDTDFRTGGWLNLSESVTERADAFLALFSLMHVHRKDTRQALLNLAELLRRPAAGLIVTPWGTEEFAATHEFSNGIPEGHRALITQWTMQDLGPLLLDVGMRIIPRYSGHEGWKMWLTVIAE